LHFFNTRYRGPAACRGVSSAMTASRPHSGRVARLVGAIDRLPLPVRVRPLSRQPRAHALHAYDGDGWTRGSTNRSLMLPSAKSFFSASCRCGPDRTRPDQSALDSAWIVRLRSALEILAILAAANAVLACVKNLQKANSARKPAGFLHLEGRQGRHDRPFFAFHADLHP